MNSRVALAALVFLPLVGVPLFAAWVSGTGRWELWRAGIREWKLRHPVLVFALTVGLLAPLPLLYLWVAMTNWRDGKRSLAVVQVLQVLTWTLLYPLWLRRRAGGRRG